MPDIHLTDEEADHLPELCMCCGEPATTWVKRTFMTQDPVIGGPSGFVEVFAIRMLLATAATPTFKFRTSFCNSHRHYWLIRSVALFGGIGGMFAVLLAGGLIVAFLMGVMKVDAPWLSCCAIGPFLLFLIVWIIPLKILQSNTIRARLNDDGVLLVNVGERYVAAVKAARQSPA
jgi:hypothetical protein